MNTSITQGSCRVPVVRHRSSYRIYGSFSSRSCGTVMPIRRRFAAIEGPTLGICCSSVMFVRLTVMPVFPIAVCWSLERSEEHLTSSDTGQPSHHDDGA